MKALDRKLLRDVLAQRGPAVAIGLVIGAGIALYVLMSACLHSLELTQRTYYERYRFADVFASLERAPNRLENEIRTLPGVAQVRTRVVRDVTLDIEDMNAPATGRMIGIPAQRVPILNDVFLRKGRYIEPGERDEILISEKFALAHELEPGDSIHAIINGSRRRLQVVGIALTPEYVYSIRPGEIIPDDRRFAVIWMEQRRLASAFSMEGGFNDVVLSLSPTATEDEVIRRLDRILEPYGGRGAYPRALQMSHWYLESEMEGLRSFGSTIPLVFLAVAAFLLNVVMTRLISVQREQIASLKALGYSNVAIAWHYMQWALVVAAIGAGFGIAVGAWFGARMTEMYTNFFDFPILAFRLPLDTVVEALAVGAVAAVLGGLASVWRAVKLPPAEAMRPEPPTTYRVSLLERLGIGRFLSQPTRITLRSIERRPARAAVSVLGIAAGAALMVGGTFSIDAMDHMMEAQFQVAQRYDVQINFYVPASERAAHEATRLPGVLAAESFRSVPVRFRFGHRSRTGTLTGVSRDDRLNRVMDMWMNPVVPPPDGVVLSEKLADVLGARVGDTLGLEVLEGKQPVREVPVVSLVDDLLGTNAYMDRQALHALMEESRVLSGAYLLVDGAREEELYSQLKETPMVAGVAIQRAAIEAFDETMGSIVGTIRAINTLFAAIIAFGVVYNAARISLAERSRELATLRVIGFRRSEIAEILLGELAIVTLVAIPIGLYMGRFMALLIVQAYDTELFRMPLLIAPRTYGLAALTVLVASFLSGWTVRRKLHKLDLVGVLKTRE